MASIEGMRFGPQIVNQKSADNAAAKELLDRTGLVHTNGEYVPAQQAVIGNSVQSPVGYYGNARAEAPVTGPTALATRPAELPIQK